MPDVCSFLSLSNYSACNSIFYQSILGYTSCGEEWMQLLLKIFLLTSHTTLCIALATALASWVKSNLIFCTFQVSPNLFNIHLIRYLTIYIRTSSSQAAFFIGLLKLSRSKKDLNDVTAAPFSVFFCYWQLKKKIENGAAVTLLRSFLFCGNFIRHNQHNGTK